MFPVCNFFFFPLLSMASQEPRSQQFYYA
jgi:hypothetical protein